MSMKGTYKYFTLSVIKSKLNIIKCGFDIPISGWPLILKLKFQYIQVHFQVYFSFFKYIELVKIRGVVGLFCSISGPRGRRD